MSILPTVCVDEVKWDKDNKFFYFIFWINEERRMLASYSYDTLLHKIKKNGFDLINKDGSLYDIEQGA